MTPRLHLKKERLTELTTDELNRVAGGAPPTLKECLSLFQNCNSVVICTTAMSCGGGCESRDICQ